MSLRSFSRRWAAGIETGATRAATLHSAATASRDAKDDGEEEQRTKGDANDGGILAICSGFGQYGTSIEQLYSL